MQTVGKEAGLNSFEQVRSFDYICVLLTEQIQTFFCLLFQVKDLYLHPETFSVANGLLTPTLKSRRADIRRVFQEKIANMYSKTAI